MSQTQVRGTAERAEPGCAVNSTFNFSVGALAILVALLVGYWAYTSWWK
jgi:hypothetical protein